MANQFICTDPRGIRIVCTEECWHRHIVGPKPRMAGKQQIVIEAIEHPIHDFIFQDNDYENRENYYGYFPGRKLFMKAVAEFPEDHSEGTIITAFPTDGLKSGEKPIWPKSKD